MYRARACGRERADGLWEGWIEFDPIDGGETLRSERETTQPNLVDLQYWVTGLSEVYLEGVMARVIKPPMTPVDAAPPPVFDGPAPSHRVSSSGIAPEATLDPYSVYEKSPSLLMQELHALRAWRLREIIREYELADATLDLKSLSDPELADFIVMRVSQTAHRL
jgi:hypothetical protein